MASPFGSGFAARPPATPGAPASPFGFGTAAFGASSAPAFGAASSAPAFGGGFGATASAFGTPSTASAFGAPAAGTGLFGAASTPAFGAATTSAFSAFGQPAAAASSAGGGLFGTAPAANTFRPTAAGSLFGTPSPAPAFGAGGSLFAPAAASTPSLFGAAPAPATSSFGAFGAPASGAAPSLFGSAAPTSTALTVPGQAPQVPGLGTDASGLGPDDAARAISKVVGAYNRNSPDYRFMHLFLSVVDNPAQRVKPPNVDETRWRQAMAQAGGPNNPDRLWPVAAYGFHDLLLRCRAQSDALSENQARLRALSDTAARLQRRHAGDLRGRVSELQRRHAELSHRLLKAARNVDALESRLGLTVGYNATAARERDGAVAQGLSVAESQLAPAACTGLQRRLEAVAAAARLRAGGTGADASSQVKLDERSTAQLFAVLREHADGVKALQQVLRRDQLDVDIMRRLTGGEDDEMVGMVVATA